MQIETSVYLDFDDVLIKPKRSSLSSRKEVDIEREFTFLHSQKKWKGVPIMASNMDTVGTFEMRDALSMFHMPTMIHKFYDPSVWVMEMMNCKECSEQTLIGLRKIANNIKYTIPSFGIREEDTEKLFDLINNVDFFPTTICFDVANGYTEKYVSHIKAMRDQFKDKISIIAGNVATPEAVEALVFAGADIVKVGIGNGGHCSTRMKAGVGVPQATAIMECSDAAHGLGAHIIADGGIKSVADVSKAFGFGADFVMIGTMFAGHKESGGELIEIEGKFMKEVYGMSSSHAMDIHYGGKADYRSSEGEYSLIPFRGSIRDTVEDILGGLRSSMTYIGAKRLKDFSKCTTFIRVNRIK